MKLFSIFRFGRDLWRLFAMRIFLILAGALMLVPASLLDAAQQSSQTASAPSAAAQPTLDASLRAIQECFDRRQPAEALSLAKETVRRFPESSDAWRLRGQAYRLTDSPQTALADYDKAVQLDPGKRACPDGAGSVSAVPEGF